MPAISAVAARQWFSAVRATLVQLKKIYPLGANATELPSKVLAETTRGRIMRRLVEAGFITSSKQKFFACPEAIELALANDALIADALWPKSQDLSQLQIVVPPPAPPAPPPVPPSAYHPLWSPPAPPTPPPPVEIKLAPPPPIENMRRPPEGASPEVVQEWIFTMLHAQTENLIYIREQVDKLLRQWS